MKSLRLSTLLFAAIAFAGCDSNDGPESTPPVATPTFNLQVLHASPDAPAVNVIFNGSEVLSGVDYKTGSGQLRLNEGTYPVQVDGILPAGPAPVIGPVDVTFSGEQVYTIAAVGKVADMTLEPVVLAQPRTEVSAGSARAFVLHAAPNAPAVDVYVTVPGSDLTSTPKLGTFSFKGTLGPAEVTAGDYQIRVTPENMPTMELYDSGTVTLNDGDDLLLAAVENTGTGSAPVSIVVMTGAGSAEIATVDTKAELRVIHAAPDAPNVDVFVNDTIELVDNLAFPDATAFIPVDGGTYNVKVAHASNSSAVVIDADLTLDAGVFYDVLAVGTLTDDSIEPLVLTDDYRRVATAAKVRIVHASPAAQDVDIYLTEPQASIADLEPTLADVPYKANTGFLSLAPGTYDVTVTAADSKEAAIGPATVTIEAGGIYTVIARDAAGGGTPLNLILLDDPLL